MKLYCLHEGLYEGVQLRLDQLNASCNKLNIDFIAMNSLTVDYTNLPTLSKCDLLYNCARGSQTLETILLNDKVTTFYIKNPKLNQTFSTTDWSILHDKANLPAPKTIYHITADRKLLKIYVDFLGGFPIILKETGSTRGIGTIKIESWQNLISTVDYLVRNNNKFIFRQFIKAKSGCRMIVLGDKVIAAANFEMNENDFRNAAVLSQVKYYKSYYPEAIKQLAVTATHIANTEFSGVDFLQDEQDNYYLLEVNFPTGFSSLIEICDVDIPTKMILHLVEKANA